MGMSELEKAVKLTRASVSRTHITRYRNVRIPHPRNRKIQLHPPPCPMSMDSVKKQKPYSSPFPLTFFPAKVLVSNTSHKLYLRFE